MVTTTKTKCECQRELAKSVARRERARERQARAFAKLSPELRAYWEGSIQATMLQKPVRVRVAGGCSCGAPEAVAA
jgi:hypothetical protein